MPAIPTGSRPVALTPVPAHELAHGHTPDPHKRTAIRSFTPVRTPKLQATATGSPVSHQLLQHPSRRQIPIASVALSGAPLTAISCLGAFRTPASRARARFVFAGIRKPAHRRTFDHLRCQLPFTLYEGGSAACRGFLPGRARRWLQGNARCHRGYPRDIVAFQREPSGRAALSLPRNDERSQK